MSEIEITPTAPTTPPVQPPAEPPKPVVLASSLPEDALKARLDSAKKTGQDELLRSLGVQSTDQLKAALDAIKAADEAKKTDAEKQAAQLLELQTAQTKLGEYAKAVDSVWAAEAGALTAEQLAAVTAIAGEDTAKRVQVVHALRPTWGKAPAPTPAPVVPVNTSPAPNAPPAAGATSPMDAKTYHQQLQKRNPVLAAQFAELHSREIYG